MKKEEIALHLALKAMDHHPLQIDGASSVAKTGNANSAYAAEICGFYNTIYKHLDISRDSTEFQNIVTLEAVEEIEYEEPMISFDTLGTGPSSFLDVDKLDALPTLVEDERKMEPMRPLSARDILDGKAGVGTENSNFDISPLETPDTEDPAEHFKSKFNLRSDYK